MADLLQHVIRSGFPIPAALVHVFIGGSELHGAKVGGTDDLDIYGVYVEPASLVLGLDSLPHYVWSTAGDDRRNGPDDVDVTLYSLKRWAELACKGNPTALHFLFANGTSNRIWQQVVQNSRIFLSQACARQFTGFAKDQLLRMTGQKGRGKKGHRTEIEERYGYDVKAAMHSLRLLYECRELISTGKITLPRPECALLVGVRTGEFSQAQVLDMADELFKECELAHQTSELPERLDREIVSELIVRCYQQTWSGTIA